MGTLWRDGLVADARCSLRAPTSCAAGSDRVSRQTSQWRGEAVSQFHSNAVRTRLGSSYRLFIKAQRLRGLPLGGHITSSWRVRRLFINANLRAALLGMVGVGSQRGPASPTPFH